MKKRFLSLLLTGVMVLSMGAIAFADTAPTDGMDREHEINAWIQNLKDVSSKDWFYPILPGVYGIMTGVSDTEFAPNQSMTRAMFATILYRLDGGNGKGTADAFTDVPAGQWYTDAVNWAAENKIVNGVGEKKFAPNNYVTREQMAVMLKKFSEYKKDELRVREKTPAYSSFPDVITVSSWARESMKWSVEKGLMKGTTVGLEPQATATRAQVAQLIYNYIMSR